MKDLFEDLREMVGCDYISDLRFGNNTEITVKCVMDMCVDAYSIAQWNDLAEYLFEDKRNFTSTDEVTAFLKSHTCSEGQNTQNEENLRKKN